MVEQNLDVIEHITPSIFPRGVVSEVGKSSRPRRYHGSCLIPCASGRTGCIVVRLSGTDLHAEITSEWISATDNQHLLDGFFASVAQLEKGASKDWLSESEDFAISPAWFLLFRDLFSCVSTWVQRQMTVAIGK